MMVSTAHLFNYRWWSRALRLFANFGESIFQGYGNGTNTGWPIILMTSESARQDPDEQMDDTYLNTSSSGVRSAY